MITLMLVCLVHFGSLAISSVISQIMEVFPGTSAFAAQMLMTSPGIFIMVMSFVGAGLTRRFTPKRILLAGLGLDILAGVCGLVFHGSFPLLFAWTAMLGIGMGLWVPMVTTFASALFTEEERAGVMGRVTTAQNIGAIIMTAAGGFLARFGWHYVYLVYLIAVPGLIAAWRFLPDQKNAPAKDEGRGQKGTLGIDGQVILYGLLIFGYSVVYNQGPSNFSLLLSESGIQSSTLSGILSAMFLCGGFAGGCIFGKVNTWVGRQSIALGYILLGVGFVGLGTAQSVWMYAICAFVSGASLPMVLAQISVRIVEGKDPAQYALIYAFMAAIGNLGSFGAPFITILAKNVTGSDGTVARILFTAALSVVIGIIAGFLLKRQGIKRAVITD